MERDSMRIDILPDGSIKVTTDGSVSDANHMNAEEFLRFIARMAGGETTREKNMHGHEHGPHTHTHKKQNG